VPWSVVAGKCGKYGDRTVQLCNGVWLRESCGKYGDRTVQLCKRMLLAKGW
jgi:hypothetical protein